MNLVERYKNSVEIMDLRIIEKIVDEYDYAVNNRLSEKNDGINVYLNDIEKIPRLCIRNSSISRKYVRFNRFTDIQYFKNLEYLEIHGCIIPDISCLNNLKKLEEVKLVNCGINDIEYFKNRVSNVKVVIAG